MKKPAIILIIIVLTVIFMGSCRSSKYTCPAYSQKATTETTIKS